DAMRRSTDAVEEYVQNARSRSARRARLQKVGDLERLGVRAALGEATPRDLGALRDGLLAVPGVMEAVVSIPDAGARAALGLADDAPDPEEALAAELSRALVERPPALAREGGIFREGYDARLDETRRLKEEGSEMILALEAKLRESVNIPTLKIRYTRVFGWYIEVTKSHAAEG